MSLISRLVGKDDFKVDDKVIANDSLIGIKGMAVAYLGATLESATPEIRRMHSEYLTQCILAHEALTKLAVKRDWYQPYLTPEEQITQVFKQAEWVLNQET